MTDAKDSKNTKDASAGKTLSLSGGTLSLGGNVSSPLRPSGPMPGARNTVSVEVRRRNRPAPGSERPAQQSGGEDLRLTDQERESRARALKAAQEEGAKKTSLPKRVTLDDAKKIKEEQQKVAREKAQKEYEEMQATNPDLAVRPKRFDDDAQPAAAPAFRKPNEEVREEESFREKLKKTANKRTIDRRDTTSRITVNQALNRDFERDRGPSLAAQKRAREKARLAMLNQEPAKKIVRDVVVPEVITVQELANRMAEPGGEVVKALMKLGVMATITQSIDADTAELVISEFGHKIVRVTDADVEIGIEGVTDTDENLQFRPPVVTIMGHVDHGKTSLLDALRETDVVAGEAGGITQHIGAYQVTMKSGKKITFLDTPGHAAFTEMRARGANVTDIVVIVVSAEDSIMPQTVEAISHARAANVPIMIAINKIDLPTADPLKVKQALLQYEVAVEEMGGDVQCIEISALKKINLDKLEEAILLQAEILELKANPNREAHGFVVEAKMEKGRGSVATVLIQKGTLRVGDVFVAGPETGKVRAIIDDHGKQITHAIPGQPVEVIGLNATPSAGDSFVVVNDESKAREISSYRQQKARNTKAALAVKGRTTIDDLLLQKEAGERTVLPVLIKADVHGSLEAIMGSLEKMAKENDNIGVLFLHTGVGGITESDVTLARASKGIIIGFNVRANAQARDLAQRESVDIRYYNIIYNVIDDAKAILTGMLAPTQREEYLGQAEILQVFNITKVGKVAGCKVTTGTVKRGAKVRLLRDNIVIHEGTLKTLKRHQDEVKDVREGMECGMAFESYDDIKAGDIIECYEIITEARTLNN